MEAEGVEAGEVEADEAQEEVKAQDSGSFLPSSSSSSPCAVASPPVSVAVTRRSQQKRRI